MASQSIPLNPAPVIALEPAISRVVAAAESHGVDTAEIMLEAVSEMLEERAPRGRGLTTDQARYLVASGAMTAERFADLEQRLTTGDLVKAQTSSALRAIRNSVSAAEAAALIGITSANIRERNRKALLFSFIAGKAGRYPEWQFVRSGATATVLPHLASIVSALPSSWHPATVEAFMTTVNEDLPLGAHGADSSDDEHHVSPRDWLIGGQDAARVVALLDATQRS